MRGRLWWLDEAFDASEFPDEEQMVHVRPVLFLDDRHERHRRGGDVYDLMLGEPRGEGGIPPSTLSLAGASHIARQ